MNKPVISIIIPCYNQGEFIKETLASVYKQTFHDWECIIVNDGSTDNTEEVVQHFLSLDERFKYIIKKNTGLAATRNYGIEKANGKYILPLDADDKIGNDYIKFGVALFSENQNAALVYCDAKKFGAVNEIWSLEPFSLYNLSKKNMIFCSAIFKKADWLKVGGYDIQMKYGWEDWEFWISILKNGGQVLKLDYKGFYYRIKDTSMLIDMNKEQSNYSFKYLSVKHADFFVEQLGSFHELALKTELLNMAHQNQINKNKYLIKNIFSNLSKSLKIVRKNE